MENKQFGEQCTRDVGEISSLDVIQEAVVVSPSLFPS
jgi:hypothetical protein